MNHTDPKSLRTSDAAFTGENGDNLQTIRDRVAQTETGIRYSHGECILSFSKSEMKNGCSFEHILPVEVANTSDENVEN